MMKTSLKALLQAILVLACGTALAERADKNKPINLEADSAVFDDAKKMMVIEGKVVLTKGTLVMRASRIEQRQDPQGNQFLNATAKPAERVFFRQKREGLDEFMEGEAQRIEYDGKLDVIRFSGKAVLRRIRGATLADESAGEVIVYNNATETMSINGAPATAGSAGQRVRMMLSPKADAAPAPDTSPTVQPALRGAAQIK